jgi:hypothetical protein
MSLELLLLIGSSLILLSIAIARLSDNAGVPVLVLFLGIGMLAGVDGPGGIVYDNTALTQSVGIICLVFILFAGGLDTHWSDTRPVAFQAFSLATIGVLVTALVAGLFAHCALGFPLEHGLLLGAVISSTDAAAVFSVLRTKNVNLRGTLRPLLELESGSNDPMAVFLTIGLIASIQEPASSCRSFSCSLHGLPVSCFLPAWHRVRGANGCSLHGRACGARSPSFSRPFRSSPASHTQTGSSISSSSLCSPRHCFKAGPFRRWRGSSESMHPRNGGGSTRSK